MKKPTIFDYQAQVGLTKHLGGLQATKRLVEGCAIHGDSQILEIGCGVGTTAVFLATTYGCRVTGVDLSERMIQRARQRAQAEKVQHLTEFRTADMDQLPFPSNAFDVVFCESVLVFSKDKTKAVAEMARVARPGGYVAINETIWLQAPNDELIAWFAQDMAAEASTLTFEEWAQLFEQADLTVVSWEKGRVEIKEELRGIIDRYGYLGLLRIMLRMIVMYFQRRDYREFIAETRRTGVAPGNPEEYMGFAIIITQKSG